jgi:hypothetical protein
MVNYDEFPPLFYKNVLNNPLVPELNAWYNVHQTGSKGGLHNKGHDRPLAIPIVLQFEYQTV